MSTQIRSTSAPPQRSVDKGCALHAVRTCYRQAGDGERYKSGEQMPALHTEPWRVQRLGIVMEPDLADPREAGGVLNPAAMRGPDGELYLLPRLVGADNCSRIGLVRVVHDRQGTPRSVTRLGVALEPEEPYERNSRTGGGVEDPRVTYVAALESYVMTYTAHGEAGPRIALAVSHDLVRWQRLGPVRLAPLHGLAFGALDNKDALLFPEPVPAPDGQPALALIHRPDLGTYRPDGVRVRAPLPGLREKRPSMWLSYAPLDALAADRRPVFGQHHLLAGPAQPWERLKVGGGTPRRCGWGTPGCCSTTVSRAGPWRGRARSTGSATARACCCSMGRIRAASSTAVHRASWRPTRRPSALAWCHRWCFQRGWTPGLTGRWISTTAWPTPASG